MSAPYFQQGNVTIYHGDARDILPTLPKVGLVLTDPPYAINAGRGEWSATAAVAIGLHEAAKRLPREGSLLPYPAREKDAPHEWVFWAMANPEQAIKIMEARR